MNSYINSYLPGRSFLSLIFILLFVVGCTNKNSVTKKTNEGRYDVVHDYGPEDVIDVSHVQNAVPKVEPLSRGGNRSTYEVFGKNYNVLSTSKGYKARGGASWYGKKFHGHLTANGERYDMFAMTAAHKSLPIPTYVKVTNLANQKYVIVRVNDRGPFHQGRVIDLSYAAASKLDMLKAGTAQVEVEAIDPTTWDQTAQLNSAKEPLVKTSRLKVVDNLVATSNDSAEVKMQPSKVADASYKPKASKRSDVYKDIHYVQVGVYSTGQAAHKVMTQTKALELPVLISELSTNDRTLYKVILGPMVRRSQTKNVIAELETLGFVGAHLVDLPK